MLCLVDHLRREGAQRIVGVGHSGAGPRATTAVRARHSVSANGIPCAPPPGLVGLSVRQAAGRACTWRRRRLRYRAPVGWCLRNLWSGSQAVMCVAGGTYPTSLMAECMRPGTFSRIVAVEPIVYHEALMTMMSAGGGPVTGENPLSLGARRRRADFPSRWARVLATANAHRGPGADCVAPPSPSGACPGPARQRGRPDAVRVASHLQDVGPARAPGLRGAG